MDAENAILNLIAEHRGLSHPFILAIDGRCASGKTTLAAELAGKIECNIVHVDDFYIPIEQRTKERMAEAGGNIDRERLAAEVLLPLREGKNAVYRRYDCRRRTFAKSANANARRPTIVEGSYSCHPDLWDFFDMHVFLTISGEEQEKRLLRRDAAALLTFQKLWIPREEYYFARYRICERCELRIEN